MVSDRALNPRKYDSKWSLWIIVMIVFMVLQVTAGPSNNSAIFCPSVHQLPTLPFAPKSSYHLGLPLFPTRVLLSLCTRIRLAQQVRRYWMSFHARWGSWWRHTGLAPFRRSRLLLARTKWNVWPVFDWNWNEEIHERVTSLRVWSAAPTAISRTECYQKYQVCLYSRRLFRGIRKQHYLSAAWMWK